MKRIIWTWQRIGEKGSIFAATINGVYCEAMEKGKLGTEVFAVGNIEKSLIKFSSENSLIKFLTL